MFKHQTEPRKGWQQRAKDFGFHFHTMYGEPYWDESGYYQFSLQQIEQDLEAPTEELQQMCLQVVEHVVRDESLLAEFKIPEYFWQPIADSWQRKDPSLYSRLDLIYNGNEPAKLLENNADTPTSLYESGFWQWLWLEDKVDAGELSKDADQFNSLQEKLISRLVDIAEHYQLQSLHFSCCKDSEEDRGTVQYLQDCATAANINNHFVYIEDIGLADTGVFTDLLNQPIQQLFKLYPWEFMQRENFAEQIVSSGTDWIEPLWKAILSNKALLPMLWRMFPNHPNLLPAWFEHDVSQAGTMRLVKKPIYSREGANISIIEGDRTIASANGPYGEEGYIYQAYSPLPKFADNHTLIGSWLVGDEAAGISVREDKSMITQDLSRYLPHIIL